MSVTRTQKRDGAKVNLRGLAEKKLGFICQSVWDSKNEKVGRF